MNRPIAKQVLLAVSALAMVMAGICGAVYAQTTCTCETAKSFDVIEDTGSNSDCGQASMCHSMLEYTYHRTTLTHGETLSSWGCVMKVNCGGIFQAPVASYLSASIWGFFAGWSEISGAAGYYLDVSGKSDFSSFTGSAYHNKSVTGTSHEVRGLTPGNTYYYRAMAYQADGTESEYSNTVEVNLPLRSKPHALETKDFDEHSFYPDWDQFAGADGYLLDVSSESDFSTFFGEYHDKAVVQLPYQVENIAPGETYYWRVRAYRGDPDDPDSLELSDYSDTIKVKLTAPPEPEPQPPLGCYLSDSIVKEKSPAGTVVGTFTASDVNRRASHTFELNPGVWSEYFVISGNVLKTAKEIIYNPEGYHIGVTTTNNKGLSRYDDFTIDALWTKELYTDERDWGDCKRKYSYYLSQKHGRRIKHGTESLTCPEGLRWEYNYQDGLLHGTSTDYSDGKKYWERNYDKGKLHGAWKRWDFDDGSLDEEGTYTQGKKTGLWTYYSGYTRYDFPWSRIESFCPGEDCVLKETYDNEGKILSATWNCGNGCKYDAAYSYEQGKVLKTVNDYWSNGNPRKRFTREYLSNDSYSGSDSKYLTGTYEEWNEDGELQYQYEYTQGRKDGPYFARNLNRWALWSVPGNRWDCNWNWYDTEEEGTYVNDILEGEWSGKREGTNCDASSSGNLENGKQEGTWTSEFNWNFGSDDSGWEKAVSTYKNGRLHGPYSLTLNNGKKISSAYRNGTEHGYYQYSSPAECNGVSYTSSQSGNIRNGHKCGLWSVNYCSYDYDSGRYRVETNRVNYGSCPESGTADSEDDPPSGFVSGRVTDGKKNLPLGGVSVSLGGNSYSTDADGYYQFENLSKGDYTLRFSKAGFYEESESLRLTNSSCKTVNKQLQPESEKPVIKGLTVGGQEARDIKFLAVDADVEISADIEWDEGSPKNISFSLNGKEFESSSGAYSFNLLNDFTASNDANANTLTVTAENSAGQKSDPFTVHPVVMPVPSWLDNLGELEFGGTTYTVSIEWPEEPVEILISQKKLGTALWSVWSLVPFVGAREFGIPASQAGFELSYNPLNAEGEVLLRGSTGFKAAGGRIIGTLGGGGEFEYIPGQGLVWNQGFLLLGISGEITKTVGPITLFPALEGAVNWAVVGGAIKWFNDRANITGKVGANANIRIGIISQSSGISFNSAKGDVGNSIGLALAVDLYAVEVELAADASTGAYWQFPANPGYLEKFEAKLVPSITFSKWGLSKTLSQEYTYTYPGSKRQAVRIIEGLGPMKPVPRDFLKHGEYSRFTGTKGISRPGIRSARKSARRSARQDDDAEIPEQEDTDRETKIIENVYPYAEPALAEYKGEAGIAFVYFDPTRRDLQATDIYLSYFDGAEYSVPAPAQKDTQAEYTPNIAFDRNGNIVAVWERIKNENLAADDEFDDAMRAMTKEMEIVYAVYYPGSQIWSEPAAVTDNAYIDHKPLLKTGRNGELLLIWVSNAGNEMMSSAQKPDKINYSVWTGEGFENIQTVPQDFANCLKYSYAYDGRNIFVAYVKDMDGDLGTSQDEEIFYLNFDGESWNEPVQLTDDSEIDDNPQIVLTDAGYPELVWLKGTTIARLTDWSKNGAYQIIRCGSDSITFTDFRVLRDPEDRLAVLWQGLNDDGEPDLFYSVYDPETDLWSKDLQLTEDSELEKAFRGEFSDDGTLHLAFNRQNLTTGKNDLYHTTYRFANDLEIISDSLQILTDTEELPAPGESATLICKVKNNGDLTTAANVSFYLGDPDSGGELIGAATAEPSELRGGEEAEATLVWTVPSGKSAYEVYAVADPDNTLFEVDEFNNKAGFQALKPDLEAVQCKIDRHGDGMTDIIAVFRNSGSVSAKDVKVSYRVRDEELNIVTVPEVEAGTDAEALFSVFADTAFDGTATKIQIALDPDNNIDESDEGNNRASAYTENPASPARCEFGGVNPSGGSETQTVTFSDTGSGIDIKSLTITGDDAAAFSVINDNCSGKDPQNSCTADLVFTPTDTGFSSATLVASFNTADKADLEIPLLGTGLQPGDFDGDGLPTLADAIWVLKILVGADPGAEAVMNMSEILLYDYADADLTEDGKLGTEDAVYILRLLAE